MQNETVIRRAQFNPKVTTYWLTGGVIGLVLSVFGIVLIPFYFIFGQSLTKRYLESMECVLTDKALKFKKGIFTKVEKTVPLEKITDLGMVQGPLMRHFDIHTLTIETAGQSGTGALLSLTGILDAEGFRETVLDQRDSLGHKGDSAPKSSEPVSPTDQSLLNSIHETLLRIEKSLNKE